MEKERRHLLDIYTAAINAVAGDCVVEDTLRAENYQENCHVIAIGKVADAMMQGALKVLQKKLQSGLLISKSDNFSDALLDHPLIDCVEGDHPIPSDKSLNAGQALLRYLEKLPADASCLFLISGGASSLVDVLDDDLTLSDLQVATQYLLASGKTIHEINTVRKRFSCIKGGGLWQYLGDRNIHCLMISDVKGDDPTAIGSGLLFPDDSSQSDILGLLPDSFVTKLPAKKAYKQAENFRWKIVACLDQAKQAAKQKAEELGYSVTLINEFMHGDAATMGEWSVDVLQHSVSDIVIWGGETTVRLPKKHGEGGRNQHLALAAAIAMSGRENQWLLSIATDGIDGVSENQDAGALVDGRSVQRGELYGFNAKKSLLEANSNAFLEESGDLICTGPSQTNVMDLLIGLRL